jgi:MFS family permease
VSTAARVTHRRWLALGLLAVTQFMLIADQTVVNIALPSMGADLDLRGVDLSWVVNAYVLTFGGLAAARRPGQRCLRAATDVRRRDAALRGILANRGLR